MFFYLAAAAILTGVVWYYLQNTNLSSSLPSEFNKYIDSIKQMIIVPKWLSK